MPPKEEIPERSNFWFNQVQEKTDSIKILDKISIIFSFCLSFFSFIIFWPVISKFSFEEAFFTPLAPFLIFIGEYFNIQANQTLRVLFIVSFMVSTLGVYFLVRDMTKRQLPAILSSIIYLIPPIPIFVLTFLRTGVLKSELVSARSFFTIIYGDGAHFMALAFIPFTLLFFLRYLKKGVVNDLVLTVIFCSLVLLANRSQALSLVLIMTISVVTESLLGLAREKLKRYLVVLLISSGLVSFWYTPNFWLEGLTLFIGQIVKNLKFLFPLPFIVGVLSLLFAFVLFARKERRQAVVIIFLIFIVFLGILLDWFINSHSFVPHPQRMFTNVNMFGSILLALVITLLIDKSGIADRFKVEKMSAYGRALTAIIFGFISFMVLSIAAYTFSPLAILAVAGPNGIWTKVRVNVIADRQEALNLAGGNFKLISQNIDPWQLWLGYGISLTFDLILIYLIFRMNVSESKKENG